MIEILGISDRVIHPEVLEGSLLRYARDMPSNWDHDFVNGRVEYGVFVPAALKPYVACARWSSCLPRPLGRRSSEPHIDPRVLSLAVSLRGYALDRVAKGRD